jgi:hypothetical protein
VSVYRSELERLAVDEWASRDLRLMVLTDASSYVFDPTDQFVTDVTTSGGVEAAWTGYARSTLLLTPPVWSSGWVCGAGTVDLGIVGTAVTDKASGLVVYEHITSDADSLLVAYHALAPTVTVWDGTNPFLVTFASGVLKVS